jgi:hypothetical protein
VKTGATLNVAGVLETPVIIGELKITWEIGRGAVT